MKKILKLTARALVEISCTCRECDCGKLCDAAIGYLRGCKCSRAQLRDFVRAVSVELRKSDVAMLIRLTTPSGKSGDHAKKIESALGKALGRRVELEENAEKDLIGGAKITYGDERFDYTLHGALTQLHDQLITV